MKQISPRSGSISCDQILSRQAAGLALDPPVSERQVRRLMDIAILFLPEFEEFEHPVSGGLNKDVKLTNWHLPGLQKIRSLTKRFRSVKKVREYLKKEQQAQ